MEDTIAVYKVRHRNNTTATGYCWIKKRARDKAINAVRAKVGDGIVVGLWICSNWRSDKYNYDQIFPKGGTSPTPDIDPIPIIKQNFGMDRKRKPKRTKEVTRVHQTVTKPSVPTFVPKHYKVERAPLKD